MNIVLSGPSGTGKGTLTEMLLKNSGFKKFTTCTTRKKISKQHFANIGYLSNADIKEDKCLKEIYRQCKNGFND